MQPSVDRHMKICALALVLVSATARADDAKPRDFIDDAKVFYRVVACKGSDPLPSGIDAEVVDKHCAEMAKHYAHFDDQYSKPAGAFFARVRPASLPTTVVY